VTTSALWQLDAVCFARAQVDVVVALFACAAFGVSQLFALVVVAAVTVVHAGRLPISAAVGLGLVTWAYFTGFVVNRYGRLTFEGPDLVRLALLLGCAAAAHWRR